MSAFMLSHAQQKEPVCHVDAVSKQPFFCRNVLVAHFWDPFIKTANMPSKHHHVPLSVTVVMELPDGMKLPVVSMHISGISTESIYFLFQILLVYINISWVTSAQLFTCTQSKKNPPTHTVIE